MYDVVEALGIIGRLKYDDPTIASLALPMAIAVGIGIGGLGMARSMRSMRHYSTVRKVAVIILAIVMSVVKSVIGWLAITLMAGPYVEAVEYANVSTGLPGKVNVSVAVILVDVSKSMEEQVGNTTRMGLAFSLACRAAEHMWKEGARVHVALFADYVVDSFDYTGNCSRLNQTHVYNYTTLRNAVAYASSYLEKLGVPGTIIMITDGEDNFPAKDKAEYLRDTVELALSVNATVIGIWVGDDPMSLSVLRSITEPTGGLVLRPDERLEIPPTVLQTAVNGLSLAGQTSAQIAVRDYETPRRILFGLLWILTALVMLVGP